jgi:hypothetical protein
MVYLVTLFLFLARISFAITPITSFTEGNYSGSGDWISQDGNAGDFKVFLDLRQSSWLMASFDAGNIYFYKTTANIDPAGFLTTQTIDESDPTNPIYYPGYGNCGTEYCQITTYLYNGILWQEFIFNSSSQITFFGSIIFDDYTPNVQWQGHLSLLP